MIFYRIRFYWKLFLRRFRCVPSFCKRCGRDVHDFIAPNWAFRAIRPLIRHGDVVCYDCFCELCDVIDLYPVWYLVHDPEMVSDAEIVRVKNLIELKIEDDENDPENAANILYDTVAEWLDRQSEIE